MGALHGYGIEENLDGDSAVGERGYAACLQPG